MAEPAPAAGVALRGNDAGPFAVEPGGSIGAPGSKASHAWNTSSALQDNAVSTTVPAINENMAATAMRSPAFRASVMGIPCHPE